MVAWRAGAVLAALSLPPAADGYCWKAGNPLTQHCTPPRTATWWVTNGDGPTGGPTNLEFVQAHRKSVTRAAAFCWAITDNGTFSPGDACGTEQFGPLQQLGVEFMPAGSVSQAALLNNTWHSALEPLAAWMADRNYTGVHVDFEEGKTGPVSEALYAYFLSTLAPVMQAKGLLVEVDVGEIFPVQDRKTDVMKFYLDALGGTPAGKLAMMGPTYCALPHPPCCFCLCCCMLPHTHPLRPCLLLLPRSHVARPLRAQTAQTLPTQSRTRLSPSLRASTATGPIAAPSRAAESRGSTRCSAWRLRKGRRRIRISASAATVLLVGCDCCRL